MGRIRLFISAAVLATALMPSAFAQRTRLEPGINLFSIQQDIELGGKLAGDAEKKLPMLNNRRVDDYLSSLGKKLAAYAPGAKFPYQFKCVNDSEINAFALPGGFLFINRGVIEAADNEVELAGVVGHEISHAALRHGTNQATKAYMVQMPLEILGSLIGGNSVAGMLAQLGSSFTANSILLKYSRDDERQADLMGAQILYDANYNPRPMADFFQKLDARKSGTEFFSSHPNPENRIANINAEIVRLGPLPSTRVIDTAEFRKIRQYVKSLPPAPKAGAKEDSKAPAEPAKRPARPSARFKIFNSSTVSLMHPDNWISYERESGFTIAPENGTVGSNDSRELAYGVMAAVFFPRDPQWTLREATDQLIANLQIANPGMRPAQEQRQIGVAGKRALSIILTNDSPFGGRETDWLVTVDRAGELVYFVFVAPEQDYASYRSTFQRILNSIRFRD